MDLTDEEDEKEKETKQQPLYKDDEGYLTGTDTYYAKRMIEFANNGQVFILYFIWFMNQSV
jgi:hypothetical protein